jgi:hypothetical protein
MSDRTEVLAALTPGAGKSLEHRLVTTMRGLAAEAAQQHPVTNALAAAETLPFGLVIASDEAAAQVVDTVRVLIDARNLLKAETERLLRIPRSMTAAVKEAVAEAEGKIGMAIERGNAARVAWQQEQRRRAAKAEAEARAQAAEAARKAALEAEQYNEDAPPVAEVATVPPPRTVAGGAGRSHTQVRIGVRRMADVAKVPTDLLQLNTVAALTAFSMAVQLGTAKKPGPGEVVEWHGIEFEGRETAVNR